MYSNVLLGYFLFCGLCVQLVPPYVTSDSVTQRAIKQKLCHFQKYACHSDIMCSEEILYVQTTEERDICFLVRIWLLKPWIII
jgi:hypothetical protein